MLIKANKNLFVLSIFCPLFRYGSWLEAAFYYAEHFTSVKNTFSGFVGGKLVTNAQRSLNDTKVFESLTEISRQYRQIKEIFDSQTNVKFSIQKASEILKSLNFQEDKCEISRYLGKRIEKNDIQTIWKRNARNLCPLDYANLLSCQATTISVERSFSILNKLLAKDRNFSAPNIEQYLICRYNSNLI